MKNINRIKRLAKNECASCFDKQGSINHYCCMVDGVCLFYRGIEKPRCKYFEQGVLPLDEKLLKIYNEEHEIGGSFTKPIKSNCKCRRCNADFEANSNRQRYCEKCRKIVKREQNRLIKAKSK